ncbi:MULTISPECIES: hypothetical protein [Sphingobacterium]|uniref:hypothetical protein n=1 Tax=Sphingobacterium TaxID=28453 RepID=UPI0008A64D93|nr:MULTISPECIES: hypothetical protein [Sphingobacterium]OFV19527.1 hypothetical protein HMPREF3127_04725 [Sphingobacterium sp. HMSC13C05]HAL51257.1 hypothetical protein [Sphingobacterium sp.]
MNRILKEALVYNDQKALKHLSKFVAKWVRDQLEDLHVRNDVMDDQAMPEINRQIRNGIYNALYILSNSAMDSECLKLAVDTEQRIPEYWEDPVLDIYLEKNRQQLDSVELKFESSFLNEQLHAENIYRLPGTSFIRSKSILELPDMDTEMRKKNLNKISAHLRREGYSYDPDKDAYVKPLKFNI